MKLAVIRASVLDRLANHRETKSDGREAVDAVSTAEDPTFGGRCPWCGHLSEPTPHVDTRQPRLL